MRVSDAMNVEPLSRMGDTPVTDVERGATFVDEIIPAVEGDAVALVTVECIVSVSTVPS
jgi:hypothetical protein